MASKQKPEAYDPSNMKRHSTRQPMPIPAIENVNVMKGNTRGSGAATKHSLAKTGHAKRETLSSAWTKRPNKDPKRYNGPSYD